MGTILLLMFSMFPSGVEGSLELWGIAALVIVARFCDVGIYYSINESASQLLYYAVPEVLRNRTRALVAGIIQPISVAGAGAILLLFRYFEEPIYNISFLAVTLSFLLVVIALNLTPDYLKALLQNLKPGDLAHRDEVLREIKKLSDNDARYVLIDSVTADDSSEAVFAVKKLFEIRDHDLISDLMEVVDAIKPEALTEILKKLTREDQEHHAEFVLNIKTRLERQVP